MAQRGARTPGPRRCRWLPKGIQAAAQLAGCFGNIYGNRGSAGCEGAGVARARGHCRSGDAAASGAPSPVLGHGEHPLMELSCSGDTQASTPSRPPPAAVVLRCCCSLPGCPCGSHLPWVPGLAGAEQPPSPSSSSSLGAAILGVGKGLVGSCLLPAELTISLPSLVSLTIPLFPAAESITAGGAWEGRDKNKREFG